LTRLRAADVLPLVAAAAIPLIFLHRHYQAHASVGPLDVYGSDILIALTVGCAVAAGLLYGWEPLRPARWLWIVSAALLALFVITCFWTPLEKPTKHLISAAKIIEYALLAPSIVLLFRRQVDVDRFLAVFVGWACAAAIFGTMMFLGWVDDPLAQPPAPRPGQREVSFLGHQDLGSFTGAALAVGVTAIALGTRRWLAVAAVAGGGIGVMLDASAFVYVGVLLGAVAVVIVARHLRTLNLRRLLAIGAVLAVVAGGVLVLRGSDVTNYLGWLGVTKPETKSVESDVQTGSQRTMLLWMGYEMWKHHPILGIGFERSNFDFGPYLAAMKRKFPNQPPEAYPSLQNPWGVQNSWVELLADTGVVGFALGVATFLTGLWLALRAAWRSSYTGLVAAGFILVAAGTLNAIGIVAGIPLDAVTWIGLGLAGVAVALGR
jgi:hypothetical protein